MKQPLRSVINAASLLVDDFDRQELERSRDFMLQVNQLSKAPIQLSQREVGALIAAGATPQQVAEERQAQTGLPEMAYPRKKKQLLP